LTSNLMDKMLKTSITKNRKKLFQGLLVALIVGLVCSLAGYFQFFSTLSQKSSDLLYRGQSSNYLAETANKIVVVGIDDTSLKEFGRISSWPRSLHARMIDMLNEKGARIIAFDILFSEASPDDAELAAAITRAGNVILPYAVAIDSVQTQQEEIIRPLYIFEQGALAVGHGNMTPDNDGVIRELPVIIDGDQLKPSLSLVTVAKYLRRVEVFDSTPDKSGLTLAGREIPLRNWGMLLNFTAGHPSGGFVTVSYADVLSGNIAPDIFRDKIVVIGVTALGFGDVYWTPLGQSQAGVEIHAQAMNTILSGQFNKPVSSSVTCLIVMLFALIVGLVTMCWRVLWSALSTLLIGAGYCLAAFYFFNHGLLLNIIHPLLALAVISIVMNLYNVTLARREKGEITRTFGKYVSPPVVTKILNTINEGSLELGGEECPVTVLFADVRGFTGVCEKLGPVLVVGTLNRYFSIIIESVLQYDGIISKFGGDSIMAVWNAPIRCPEHALFAVKAAMAAQEKISALKVVTPGLPEMKFGIGINSGKAVVGNMGSLDRLEYSLIGDTVNIASRLSALAPGNKVWIGAETYESVKHRYPAISMGPLAMKGKEQLVNVYELSLADRPGAVELPPVCKETITTAV
jgi:adenylate cyclase